MSNEHKFAFLDSNIFLHFQFFIEIPWDKVLLAESVTLVIPAVVLDELDKHRYSHPVERIRERATKATKKITELFLSKEVVRPNVDIQFIEIEPQNILEKYKLNGAHQDDHILASFLRFEEETGNYPVLITDDTPLKVRAALRGIKMFEVPEEYRIKVEDNPDKKKIAKLEKELFELKIKAPKLNLVSKDEDKRIIAQTLSSENFSMEEVKHEFERTKEKHPQITKTYKPKKTITPIISGKPYPINKVEFKLISGETKQAHLSDIEKYNRELDKFYTEYKKYLNEKLRINNLRARTVELRLKLKNEGTLPADRPHVILTFPKEFIVTTNKNVFSYPEKINPPQFITTADIFSESYIPRQFMPNFNHLVSSSPLKIKMPWEEVSIKRKESVCTASFQSMKLSHGYSLDCPETIYVIFPENQIVNRFQIQYKIAADNLPAAMEGKLKILVNK